VKSPGIVAKSLLMNENKFIFQQMSSFKIKTMEHLREDLIDMEIAEDRLKEIKKEQGVISTKEGFLKEMKLWKNRRKQG